MVDKDGTSRMTYYIWETCGVQLDDSKEPPSACPICTDERQFVGWEGQRWTTLEKMRRRRFKNRVKRVRRGLHQIITEPPFAICQRAFLVETSSVTSFGTASLTWTERRYQQSRSWEESIASRYLILTTTHPSSSGATHSAGRRCTYTNRTECGCRGRVQRSRTGRVRKHRPCPGSR